MSSAVFFAARMPASRAAESTLPLAMVWELISLRVSLCSRISPRATASRKRTGLADTSTMFASPCVSMCVSRFILLWSRRSTFSRVNSLTFLHFSGSTRTCVFNALYPLVYHRPDLFGGVELGFDVLEVIPGQHTQQIGRNQDLAVATGAGADANCRY